MARKNRFSNKKIVVKDTRENEIGDTLDGLPALNFVDGEARYFPIKKGDKELIAIFNVDKSSKVNNLKGPQRSGFIIPVWFPMLCASNSDLAIELARVFVKEHTERNYHSTKINSYFYLANYMVKNKVPSFNELDFNHLTKLCESIIHSRPHPVFNRIKKIVSLSVSASNKTKSFIQSFDPSIVTRKNIQNVHDAKSRIYKWKKSQSYSDFVMFQIYAYVNAGINEIEDTHESIQAYLDSDNYLSFFNNTGRELFKKLVESNDTTLYDEAFRIAVTDVHRVNKAMWLIRKTLPPLEYANFKTKILSYITDDLISAEWPQELQEDDDVLFTCNISIPTFVCKGKNNSKNLFPSRGYISFDTLASRWISSWKRNYWGKHYKKYQKHIHQCSVITTLFDIKVGSTKCPTSTLVLGYTEHFDFLLQVLLMAESGRNKEVIASIAAQTKIGSVLKNIDRFASEPSTLLEGHKKRAHVLGGGKQPEKLSIPHKTPMYRQLKLLDDIRQLLRPQRRMFFFENDLIKKYGRKFAIGAQIKERNGDLIGSVNSTKFRKVYAGEVLQQWMGKIKTKDDLVRAVAADLKNTIPLHYLLQSSSTEDMLSTAIVALQTKFIEHHQRIAVKMITSKRKSQVKAHEPRFLCDCIDPANPDYAENLNISYCKQFDNCLGCSKAEVYREHLPRIIYRCFQYEQILRANRELYYANYAIKHSRAQSVVDEFVAKISEGEKLRAKAVAEAAMAWNDPNNYLLPPLLHANA